MMNKEICMDEIVNILCDLGIYVSQPNHELHRGDTSLLEDIDLREYINDSLTFISFMVSVENRFGIELPDELLTINTLSSMKGFSNLLVEVINNRKEGEVNDAEIEKADPQS